MRSWNLTELDAPAGTRDPIVLETADGTRAVMLAIAPGQELREHEVKERAWVTVVEGRARFESGGESIELAGIAFETIPIPGHTTGHVAFHADGRLFSGDLVFANSVGRVDLPGGDWNTLLASVRNLADRFPPETVIYPGHGPETTLGAELARNPFLAELRAS